MQNSDDKFYCFHMDTYNNVYDLEIYHFFDVFQVIPFKLKSFNSHDWPKQNFFLQFLYNINQTSDENEENYNPGDYHLIWKQILQTDTKRTVWHTTRRIINEILRVKRLIRVCV